MVWRKPSPVRSGSILANGQRDQRRRSTAAVKKFLSAQFVWRRGSFRRQERLCWLRIFSWYIQWFQHLGSKEHAAVPFPFTVSPWSLSLDLIRRIVFSEMSRPGAVIQNERKKRTWPLQEWYEYVAFHHAPSWKKRKRLLALLGSTKKVRPISTLFWGAFAKIQNFV